MSLRHCYKQLFSFHCIIFSSSNSKKKEDIRAQENFLSSPLSLTAGFVYPRVLSNSLATERASGDRGKGKGGGRSYLRLHGPVHGGGLRGGAAVGEWFRGAGRQRGLLGRRGSLRGALNVLTVPLVGLGWGEWYRIEMGQVKHLNDWNKVDKDQVEGNHFWGILSQNWLLSFPIQNGSHLLVFSNVP